MKHVVITGGSRGIGAAVVAYFAARGDAVTFYMRKTMKPPKPLQRLPAPKLFAVMWPMVKPSGRSLPPFLMWIFW